ncbi:M23 family metallopeptidase [candidate division WWE3 bacterium]|jgi:murein DD-endopeptidase MepM/ murein hydrolase activator NlpD|nr:M23 family metallopeptidase [candidate division WWE3 bacterium]MBT7349803.1 M23 family metallopeptidase [candidate division WWE3 bacterium]
MDNIFKRLKSRRITQLPLRGFGPTVGERLQKIFRPVSLFAKALFKYLFRKLRNLGVKLLALVSSVGSFYLWLKAWIIKKLIWSRGKLGRPIANLIVLGIAFLVFTFGEILSGKRFVNSQEISPDYLLTVTDVIPNRNVATTLIPDERKQTESFTYNIESGDTLSAIGEKFKISTDALKYVNGLTDSSTLSIGDVISIPPVSGLIHEVEDGDTLASIAEKYDVPAQAVADFNYILDTSSLAVGAELVIPGGKVPTPIIPIIPTYITQPSFAFNVPNLGDGFIWPTSVNIITQYFSWYHNGLDIAVPWGWGMPPIYATSSGTVTRAGWDPWGLGLHVSIDHGNGFESVYGHMSQLNVGYGQQIGKGQNLGYMGNTGRSTGPHLHFTLKYNGVAQNPYSYIN